MTGETYYLVTNISTRLLNVGIHSSTEKGKGDTEIKLIKWNEGPGIFEQAEATVMLSAMPPDVQAKYNEFTQALIEHVVYRMDIERP